MPLPQLWGLTNGAFFARKLSRVPGLCSRGRTLGCVAALFLSGILILPGFAWAQEEPAEAAQIVELPSIVEAAEATYPPRALQDRISAVVELEIEISETGTVSEALVVRTTTIAETLSSSVAEAYGISRTSTIANYGFGSAALDAVRRIKFSPAKLEGGIPVAVRLGYSQRFELPPLPPLPTRSDTDSQRPAQVSIQGQLRERGTRSVIPGVVVTVFRELEDGEVEAYEAVSDAEGRFTLYDLYPTRWRIQGEATGYFPLRDSLKVFVGEVTEVTYYLEKGNYSPYDVFVDSEPVKREVNRRTLNREEIRTVPGTLGDPVLVVENLPGVARPAAFSGDIIVRGSGTNDTLLYVNGIEVPIIYHFGGFKSVLPVDVVDAVDFYPGNFSVYYGRGTGGVFDVQTRDLEPDQVHGVVELSLLDVSTFVQAPIGETFAIGVGGRRSVIGDIIGAAVPDDANLGILTVPVYYDGQILANWKPASSHTFRLLGLASDDRLAVLFANPTEVNAQASDGNANFAVNFQRVSLEYEYTPSERYQNTLLVAGGRNLIDVSGFDFLFELESLELLARDTARWKFDDALTFRAGVDFQVSVTDVRARLPGSPPVEGQTGVNPDLDNVLNSTIENEVTTQFAPFIEAEWSPIERLTLFPGARVDYFSLVDQWSFDPRIVARYQFDPRFALKGGVGVVFQPPLPQQVFRPFGNPGVGLQRGIQYSFGTEFKLPEGLGILSNIDWDITVFYKDLGDFVTGSDERDEEGEPLFFANTAIGRVFGVETFIEHKLNDNLRGWISYTLSRSERRDLPGEDFRLFDFDQTHILNAVVSYLLPQNWEAGFRFRLISGNTFTPNLTFQRQETEFFVDTDTFGSVPGETNSDRFPPFVQLDLRIEKTWVFDYLRLRAYLSLINTLNNGNTEAEDFNFDFTLRDFSTGIPVYPNLGIRGEF